MAYRTLHFVALENPADSFPPHPSTNPPLYFRLSIAPFRTQACPTSGVVGSAPGARSIALALVCVECSRYAGCQYCRRGQALMVHKAKLQCSFSFIRLKSHPDLIRLNLSLPSTQPRVLLLSCRSLIPRIRYSQNSPFQDLQYFCNHHYAGRICCACFLYRFPRDFGDEHHRFGPASFPQTAAGSRPRSYCVQEIAKAGTVVEELNLFQILTLRAGMVRNSHRVRNLPRHWLRTYRRILWPWK